MTAYTSYSSTPSLYIPSLSLLLASNQKLFPIHKTKIEFLTFNSKILLHLYCHKNGISGSLTHLAKLHVINLNLLPNSVLKDPFYHFHSMFQQFDLPS